MNIDKILKDRAIVTNKDVVKGTDADGKAILLDKLPDLDNARSVLRRISAVNYEISEISKFIPEMELIEHVIIGSVLSPREMTGEDMLISSIGSSELTMEDVTALTAVIDEHFSTVYKIRPMLPKMCTEMMFASGAHITAFIPESNLDRVISGAITQESLVDTNGSYISDIDGLTTMYRTNIGIFTNVMTQESIDDAASLQIEFLDNPEYLKISKLKDRALTAKFNNGFRSLYSNMDNITEEAEVTRKDIIKSTELKKLSAIQLHEVLEASSKDAKNNPMINVDSNEICNVGKPFVMRIPTGACKPITAVNDPTKHLAYIVLIDPTSGHPINSKHELSSYRDRVSNMSLSDGLLDNKIPDDVRDQVNNDEAYISSVLKTMLEKVTSIDQSLTLKIDTEEAFTTAMLARSLRSQKTEVLLIPAKMVSYMAMDHNDDGIGKSLMYDSMTIASIRIMVAVTELHTMLSNALPNTKLMIKLDPRDTDPLGTAEKVKDAFLRTRSTSEIMNAGFNPQNITNLLNEYGVSVIYEGHPDLPDMDVSSSTEYNNSFNGIDQDFKESITEQFYMSLGVTSAMIDEVKSMDAETAASIATFNTMHNKKTAVRQRKLEPAILSHIKAYTNNSAELIAELKGALKGGDEDAKRLKVELFIESLEVILPSPENTTLERKISSLSDMRTYYEDALDMILNEDAFDDEIDFEGITEKISTIKAIAVSYLLRRFMRENKILPELIEMVDVLGSDNKDDAISDPIDHHRTDVSVMMRILKDLYKSAGPKRNKYNSVLEKLKNLVEDGSIEEPVAEEEEPVSDVTDDEEAVDADTDVEDADPTDEEVPADETDVEDTDPANEEDPNV